MGKLVLKNIGREPIRLCTFCGRYGGIWTEGKYKVLQEGLDPEFWKSDRPRDEEFDKHIAVVPPGETVALPISFGVVAAGQIKVSVEYTVGKGFAQRHNVWFGAAKAPPITVDVSHGQLGVADKTLDYYQQWLKLHEELLRDNPQSAQLARDVSVSLESMGAFLAARGQPGDVDKALDYYQRKPRASREAVARQSSVRTGCTRRVGKPQQSERPSGRTRPAGRC